MYFNSDLYRPTMPTQQNAVSDQGLPCLLIECSIKIRIKMKNSTQRPLKRKRTGPGPDPDIAPLGGTNLGEGSRGPPRPLWVQGKALVGGSGGRSPPKQNDFQHFKWLWRALLYHVSCIFFIFRVLRNASNPHICM